MSQIWDCFYVNDELDLLETRLAVLSEAVDAFVIVEAPLTFSGFPKPLYFQEAADRFDTWLPKIKHVVADLPSEAFSAWDREYAQRTAMGQFLKLNAGPDDVLVVGDVDELPFPWVLRDLAEQPPVRGVRLGMRHANYYANWVMKTEWDLGPIAFTRDSFKEPAVAHLLGDPTLNERSREGDRRAGCGWHLSFLGGPEQMRTKIRAYSHQDFATEAMLSPGHLERCVRWGSALTGYHVLHKQTENELDELQKAVRTLRPEWFDFSHPSTPVRAHAYNAYCRQILTDSVPLALRSYVSRRPELVTGALLPYFLGVDTLRRLRDRR